MIFLTKKGVAPLQKGHEPFMLLLHYFVNFQLIFTLLKKLKKYRFFPFYKETQHHIKNCKKKPTEKFPFKMRL
jgi:hypothetical protein